MDDTESSEDKADDEKSDDEKSEDEKSEDETGDEGGGPPTEERLDEVGRHIDRARSLAEDAVEGVEAHEERFVDSGSEESKEADDQTDAPG